MNKKLCVVFIRNSLENLGGIETYVYQSIKQVINNRDIPIWVSKDFSKVNEAFRKVMCGKDVQWYERQKTKKLVTDIQNNNDISEIKIITFCPYDFCLAEDIKKNMSGILCETFIFIPHFQGDFLYLEEGFVKKETVIKKLGVIYQKLEKNSNIRYFSDRHLREFRERYGCQEINYDKVQVPKMREKVSFEPARVKDVYTRKEFVILSVSRLEFPHKGFILGLIDEFAKLCKRYDFIKLVIIGEGDGRKQLDEKISQLDKNIVNKIEVIGAVAPDVLNVYYDKANLVISLAGCFTLAARRGVLSLPARHYCEKCEVYGYLPNSKSFILSAEKGMPVLPFIEEVLNMSYEEYFDKCKACFDAYDFLNNDVHYFDKLYNVSDSILTKTELKLIRKYALHNKVENIIRKMWR